MISAQDLVRYRLDPASLRLRFDTDTPGPAETRLIKRWAARAQQGRDWNLQHYKLYLAIDHAWDADFYQSSQTLVGLLKDLSETKNMEDAVRTAQSWNMPHLVCAATDPKTGLPTGGQTLNLPVLYAVTLSLARSYTMMRVARVVNERMSKPFMKYEPAYTTDLNRLRCEIHTQLANQKDNDFGYTYTFSQAEQFAAMYGHQIQFIQEEWYTEDDYDGGPRPGKEGLRYVLPHPSRCYYDLNHPIWTINTNTGVKYIGYWRTTTYGEVRNNRQFWNTARVKASEKINDASWQLYFQTTGQCRISHTPMTASGNYVSKIDREANQERPYFTISQDEKSIWLTEHFEKFNPRLEFDDPAMPNCDIWFRVVMGSDDTPLYVAALPDKPAIVWLYEPHDGRSIQEGMMLQVLPFQDHASNLITQTMISVEQNLANLTLYDESVIDPAHVRGLLENPNKALYRKRNFLPFKSRDLSKQLTKLDEIFRSFTFPPLDVTNHIQVLGQLLGLLERVVGMSAQEVGSYASHEQSAEEMRQIHTATSQRYEYVASWADRAIEAWKSQLYTYTMCYGKGYALATISPDLLAKAIESGFRLEPESASAVKGLLPNYEGDQAGARIEGRGENGFLLKAPLEQLRVEAFSSQRDGPNRVPWPMLGQQMIQLLTTLMASPVLANQPKETVRLLNMSFEAMGFPRNFRIPDPEEGQPDMQAWVLEQLRGLAQQTKGVIDESQQKTIEKLTELVDRKQNEMLGTLLAPAPASVAA